MRNRSLIPSFFLVEKLPQWIYCSDVAAYHPWYRNIWISTLDVLDRPRTKFALAVCIVHELGHHFIEVVFSTPEDIADSRYHRFYDGCYEFLYLDRWWCVYL